MVCSLRQMLKNAAATPKAPPPEDVDFSKTANLWPFYQPLALTSPSRRDFCKNSQVFGC
jgi:hypothetical protein